MHTTSTLPLSRHDTTAPRLRQLPSPWRVLIVDRQAGVRQSLRAILEAYSEIIEVVGDASKGDDALVQAGRLHPDLVLMDVTEDSGEATARIKRLLPAAMVVGLSKAYNPHHHNAMIAAGAVAFVRTDDASDLLFRTIVYTMSTYCPLISMTEPSPPPRPFDGRIPTHT